MSEVRFVDHDGVRRLADELGAAADRIALIEEHFSDAALPDNFGGLYFGPVIRPTYQYALDMCGRRMVEHGEAVRAIGDRIDLALGVYERNASEMIAELERLTEHDRRRPGSSAEGLGRNSVGEGVG